MAAATANSAMSQGLLGAARRLDEPSAARLQQHALFRFQIRDARVAASVRELRELLGAARSEPDQGQLLAELVYEIEERLQGDAGELFLLAALQKFAQELELLLDLDAKDAGAGGVWRGQNTAPPPARAPRPSRCDQTAVSTPAAAPAEDELRCAVCWQPDSSESDPIVICEICGVAVHQTCYRIDELPAGDWFCLPCARYTRLQAAGGVSASAPVVPTHALACQACLTTGGALVPSAAASSAGDAWVHLVCTMFLPELYVLPSDRRAAAATGSGREQIFGGAERLGARRRLRCCFCKTGDKGACAQCVVGRCKVAYHPLCAVRHGIQIRFLDELEQFGSACLRHQPGFLRSCGADDGAGGDEDGGDEVVAASDDEDEDEEEEEDAWTPRQTRRGGPRPAAAASSPSSGKRGRASRNPWSEDDDEGDESVLDSESDPDVSDSDPGDSDVDAVVALPGPSRTQERAAIDDTKPSRQQRATAGTERGPKRLKQSSLTFGLQPPSEPPTPNDDAASRLRASAVGAAVGAARGGLAPGNRAIAPQASPPDDVPDCVVFCAALTPPRLIARPDDPDEDKFEYVMVLCWRQPLRIGVAGGSSPSDATGVFLKAAATRNPAVLEALEKGIVRDGDEIVAFNDRVLRDTNTATLVREIMPTLSLPSIEEMAAVVATPSSSVAAVPATEPSEVQGSDTTDAEAALTAAALSPDWPWSQYLRSDGKLAMNLFWRSLDAGFFPPKLNKRELATLQERIEQMTGLRLSHAHPEYAQVRALLTMPRRERVPSYLVTFRKSRKSKQHFLSSDIFVGVHKEGAGGEEVAADESVPIAVGTTVTVAKRTWPGINKLGGAGRIRKVNEEKLADGGARYTYNVSYVLGGNEKNIERKYISVVDLSKDAGDERDKAAAVPSASSDVAKASTKAERRQEDGVDDGLVSMRLSFRVAVRNDEATRLALPAPEEEPRRRRFRWQVSVADGSVFCERKAPPDSDAQTIAPRPKELLLHKHFDVQPQPDAVAISECFAPVELVRIDDGTGDEILDEDEEDEESEEEETDVIKKELAELQSQLRGVTETNELLFAQLTQRVEAEYASRAYRSQALARIQWRNYERMYTELAAARKAFDDSGDEDAGESDEREDGGSGGDGEDEDEDESCGGMFVNRVKAESSEACALCELSGGDFAATACGRVVHPQCAMYTPETYFVDGVAHGLGDVPADRGRLKCADCGGRRGLSKIQCASKKCTLAFHVACAYVKGLLTREPLYQVWCPRHLKSSGMAAYLDLPPHLKGVAAGSGADATASAVANAGRRKVGRPRGRKPSQPPAPRARGEAGGKSRRQTPDAAAAPTAGDISSSKSNRKRKRRGSAGAGRSPNGRREQQSAGGAGAFGADKPSADASADLRCARRLAIDEESDENEPAALGTAVEVIDLTAAAASGDAAAPWRAPRDSTRVFKVNDVVEVQSRVGPGVNKPGGVARVKAVETAGASAQQPGCSATNEGQVVYDVAYVLDNSREKHIPAAFVRSYVSTEIAGAGTAGADARKKSRRE